MEDAPIFDEVLARTPRSEVDVRDGFGATAFLWAAKQNDIYQIRRMLEKGADPNVRDVDNANAVWYGLRGCNRNTVQCLDLLHKSGASFSSVSSKGSSALHEAVRMGATEDVLELCLRLCGSTELQNHAGMTPLQYAVKENLPHERVSQNVEWLLHKGASIAGRDCHGFGAVEYAVWYGRIVSSRSF